MVCALPAGSRRAHDQGDALDVLDRVPELLELRADRQATIAAVWRELVYRADHGSRTVTTTWSALQAAAGCSRATVARVLRWLRDVGLLGVVHTGATAAAVGGDLNRAPTYVLAVPVELEAAALPVDEIETPPDRLRSVDRPCARERELEVEPHDPALRLEDRKSSTTRRASGPSWILSAAPATAGEQLEAAEALRWHAVTLRPVSARMLRHILRPWFAAGWSPRDVLYGLDHAPGGAPWRYAGMPRAVAAWVRWRLGAWQDGETGAVLRSRSQVVRAEAAERARAREARAGARA